MILLLRKFMKKSWHRHTIVMYVRTYVRTYFLVSSGMCRQGMCVNAKKEKEEKEKSKIPEAVTKNRVKKKRSKTFLANFLPCASK